MVVILQVGLEEDRVVGLGYNINLSKWNSIARGVLDRLDDTILEL